MINDRDDPKFTKQRRGAILDAISHHIPERIAVESNGISYVRFLYWISRGNDDNDNNLDSNYAEFLTDLRRVEMQAIRTNLDIISARPDNWESHAWLLEKRWPMHYKESQIEIK